jgi:hypothetical protein
MHLGEAVQFNHRFYSLRSIDHNYGPTYHSICGNIGVYLRTATTTNRHNWGTSSLLPMSNHHLSQTGATQRSDSHVTQGLLPQAMREGVRLKSLDKGSEHCSATHIAHLLSDITRCQPNTRLTSQLCMFPEKRFGLSNQQSTTTKVAIHTNALTDLYAFIGTGNMQAGWYTTVMQLPFIAFIWIGFLLAACGGFHSLFILLNTNRLRWL